MEVTYGKRKHRGGLEASLSTSVEISSEEFLALLNDRCNNYDFYGVDYRCRQIVFCGNYNLEYMWLYIQFNLDVEHSIESKLINAAVQLSHIVEKQENEIAKYKTVLDALKNHLHIIPMNNGNDVIGIGCPSNEDVIEPNDFGYDIIKEWLKEDKSE